VDLTEPVFKIPHAFQQQLLHEKILTLCNAFPAFEGMKKVWEEHQHEHPEMFNIMQEGLDKLEDYRDCADNVPAYILAMCTSKGLVYNSSFTD